MDNRLPARLGAVFIIIALICPLITGCGKKQPENVTTIRFSCWGNDIEEVNIRSLVAEFEKKHPNIKVDLEIMPWSRVLDKLMISSAGGRPPDVTRISSLWSAPLAAKGLLEPLDSYVKRDNFDIDDFYPQAIEGWGKYNGVLYELPTDIEVFALYYNKEMFDKYKIPYPEDSWDWEKYVEVAKKFTRDLDGDGQLDQWGTTIDVRWQNYIFQNGGKILGEDRNRCILDQPAAYNGLQFRADLTNKYHVAPNAQEAANVGTNKLFTSGRIAMCIGASYIAELVLKKEAKFDYDVAMLPKGPKGRAAALCGAAYGMLARSKHKNEAWELVKWMTGKQYQRRTAITLQIFPSRKSVAQSGAYLYLNAPPKNRRVFVDMIKYGQTLPMVSCAPEMTQVTTNELDLVWLGRESAEQGCKKLVPRINQMLRHSD
ncbi:sugar ABC transporter substrate-binding protein [bacterium]|nr:sugar ABC transporter substrate-binding protein [bacterium]